MWGQKTNFHPNYLTQDNVYAEGCKFHSFKKMVNEHNIHCCSQDLFVCITNCLWRYRGCCGPGCHENKILKLFQLQVKNISFQRHNIKWCRNYAVNNHFLHRVNYLNTFYFALGSDDGKKLTIHQGVKLQRTKMARITMINLHYVSLYTYYLRPILPMM